MWSSGEPVTCKNWAPNEPNNIGGEHHVEMWTLTALDPQHPNRSPAAWNDGRGALLRYPLIEVTTVQRIGWSSPACNGLQVCKHCGLRGLGISRLDSPGRPPRRQRLASWSCLVGASCAQSPCMERRSGWIRMPEGLCIRCDQAPPDKASSLLNYPRRASVWSSTRSVSGSTRHVVVDGADSARPTRSGSL